MAAVVGVVVVLGSGCEDPAPKKGPAGVSSAAAATPSPSPSPSTPAMPSLVGQKFADAEGAAKKLVSKPVEARSAYSDVPLAADHTAWAVCFQTPAAGVPVEPASTVELSLVAPGRPCPDKAGAALAPSKAPAASPTPAPPKPKTSPPTDGGSTGGDGGASGAGSGAYYKTCAEAKAAGAAPMRRGRPGYREALDRDKDGIACDK
ncbi:excalibur calcium-binding domain-containing protein [Streptomyces sp. NBC_01006]|uniref:excalibur calcium-binding domain-containing protein n=1 Tax=Streptomyces sp. NBC_01006 TaxID=2903716 RepID=UPI00386D872D|nr:excalibur calcium-binding domain-containing protein [Streptomyces sp. NBC_01006]